MPRPSEFQVLRQLESRIPQFDNVATGSYFNDMRSIGIKALKNKLSEYIRIASQGETVLVTDRDRVVAEITAPRHGRSPEVKDAVLSEAVRKGWITPPLLREQPGIRKPVAPLEELLQDLEDQRGDR